ncbi:hypothetical protein SKAU_G00144620 [Synaphobranchus kaupii]|uniref:Uncharacterized protein n=1 Tax=Synaphobranchus kaupii TaxID=118154 RepID=A0A9Q1J4B4_SYNKA|nr:hypothetical protein SKAU_G00144620 [Synaphobranchus kaupii]
MGPRREKEEREAENGVPTDGWRGKGPEQDGGHGRKCGLQRRTRIVGETTWRPYASHGTRKTGDRRQQGYLSSVTHSQGRNTTLRGGKEKADRRSACVENNPLEPGERMKSPCGQGFFGACSLGGSSL